MNRLISKDTQFRISAGKNVIFKQDLSNIYSFLNVSHSNFLLLFTLIMASWWHQNVRFSGLCSAHSLFIRKNQKWYNAQCLQLSYKRNFLEGYLLVITTPRTFLNIKIVTMCFLISYRVLRLSDGLGEPGAVNWDLALCLLFAWVLCFVCIVKGVKISGKVFNCAFVRAFCTL